jgi:hypothetical protein
MPARLNERTNGRTAAPSVCLRREPEEALGACPMQGMSTRGEHRDSHSSTSSSMHAVAMMVAIACEERGSNSTASRT